MMKTRICLAVAVLLCVSAGCVATSGLYAGKPVVKEQIIALRGEPVASGRWQTFDMTIDYRIDAHDGVLEISGEAGMSQHYQLMYEQIRGLRVYLFLVDGSGFVLETVALPAHLTSPEETFRFSRSVRSSNDLRGLSFGYKGFASEKEDFTYFDNLP